MKNMIILQFMTLDGAYYCLCMQMYFYSKQLKTNNSIKAIWVCNVFIKYGQLKN